MHRDEIVRALRQLNKMRSRVERMEDALGQLNECEREIIEKMYIQPTAKASDKLCEMFDIEVAG